MADKVYIHESRTWERHDGETPAGGAYMVAIYLNDDGQSVPKEQATKMKIIEYDRGGNALMRTYASCRRKQDKE